MHPPELPIAEPVRDPERMLNARAASLSRADETDDRSYLLILGLEDLGVLEAPLLPLSRMRLK
jgi:hypothetical protein